MFARLVKSLVIVLIFIWSFSAIAVAEQEKSYVMDNDRLESIIQRLDKGVEGKNGLVPRQPHVDQLA